MTPKYLLSLMATAGFLTLTGCTTVADLTHSGPIDENYGDRTLGAQVEDESIETKVEVNLGKVDARFNDAHVNVNAYNGMVLLTGQVPSDELKQRATDVAKDVRRVRQVQNTLEISANAPASQRVQDTWLTTRIKAKLAADANIDSGRILVLTENASVYLMGIVTQSEAKQIVNKVSEVGGIQRIAKVFEYLD
ncbi:BON domain-containing protein [Cobetia crustatorum]|uniref:BON domain-containing protein n=1 Tax=Cobetia crustatorum TaxID=553385 RepID=A0A558HXR5_9GAMM|nr:BON domain-containing protein [Cobetia crustatorum]TVU73907.1 BON domain-containing protein [Cobetia crustatorum]